MPLAPALDRAVLPTDRVAGAAENHRSLARRERELRKLQTRMESLFPPRKPAPTKIRGKRKSKRRPQADSLPFQQKPWKPGSPVGLADRPRRTCGKVWTRSIEPWTGAFRDSPALSRHRLLPRQVQWKAPSAAVCLQRVSPRCGRRPLFDWVVRVT